MNVGATITDHRRDAHESNDHLVVVRLPGARAETRDFSRELLARDGVKRVLVPLRQLAK
jgi:hypothetical protein